MEAALARGIILPAKYRRGKVKEKENAIYKGYMFRDGDHPGDGCLSR